MTPPYLNLNFTSCRSDTGASILLGRRGNVTNCTQINAILLKMPGLNVRQRAARDRLKTQMRETSNGQLVASGTVTEQDEEGTWRVVGVDEDDIDVDEVGIDATQNDLENEDESNLDIEHGGNDEHDDDEVEEKEDDTSDLSSLTRHLFMICSSESLRSRFDCSLFSIAMILYSTAQDYQ